MTGENTKSSIIIAIFFTASLFGCKPRDYNSATVKSEEYSEDDCKNWDGYTPNPYCSAAIYTKKDGYQGSCKHFVPGPNKTQEFCSNAKPGKDAMASFKDAAGEWQVVTRPSQAGTCENGKTKWKVEWRSCDEVAGKAKD